MIKTVQRVRYGPIGLNEAGTNCTLGVKATCSWSTQSERKATGANIKGVFTSKTEIEESDESWLAHKVNFIIDTCAKINLSKGS